MQDPKKADERGESPTPPRTKGGFGEFADVYRARWAANHPHMRPRQYGDNADATLEAPATPVTPSPAEPVVVTPQSDNGTKPQRSDDGTP